MIADPCPPFPDCRNSVVGHDCWGSACDWSFGLVANCPLNPIKIDQSCREWIDLRLGPRSQQVYDFTSLIIQSFYIACKAARNCACSTYWDDEWQAKLSSEGFLAHNWKSIWHCIADICRTGDLEIKCGSVDSGSAESTIGRRSIKLDPAKMRSWANNLLHELFHVCGIWGGPGEQYPEGSDPLAPASAPAWISNRCIDSDTRSIDLLTGKILGENIIAPDPPYPPVRPL